ncbi:MAG: MBL fold metallo-hydrolase [Anaerolineae bacterium]|nr:MBL fold metallo-hydrolase [Anaerolineae bacterium]
MRVQEVAPGVYAATGLIGANVGLIVAGERAVLVDAPFVPAQARAWRREIERLSPRGVAYVVVTDHHLDHTLGTCYLPEALVVAHETAWKHLRGLSAETATQRALEMAPGEVPDLAGQLADLRIVQPQLTLGKAMALWCEGQRIDILHLPGHTAGTLGVYLPAQRVLFSGDTIVNGCHPYAGDASLLQWLESLEAIRSMDLEAIVPGHGPAGGPEMIEPLRAYLQEFRERVEECFLAGHTRRETVERVRPLEAFPVPPGQEEHLRRLLRASVERVYDEIKRAAMRDRQRT